MLLNKHLLEIIRELGKGQVFKLLLLLLIVINLSCDMGENKRYNIQFVNTNYVWDTIGVVNETRIIDTDSGQKLEVVYIYHFRGVMYTNKAILDTLFNEDFMVNEKYIISIDELDFSKSKILPYKQ